MPGHCLLIATMLSKFDLKCPTPNISLGAEMSSLPDRAIPLEHCDVHLAPHFPWVKHCSSPSSAPPTSFLKLPKFLIIAYPQFPYLKNENVCLNYLTGVLKLSDEIINDMWKQVVSGGECLPSHWGGGVEIKSPQVPGQPRSKDSVSKEKEKTVKIFKNV